MTLSILLRLLHILSSMFWFGTAIFVAAFLVPAVRGAGPAGGAVMRQLTEVRRLPLYMMFVPITSVLSGFALLWRDSNGFSGEWMRTPVGRTFSMGGGIALIALIIGGAFIAPTANRIGALAAKMGGGPPSADVGAEMQALQSKMGRLTATVAVLLGIAGSAMAVARYMT